MSLRCVTTFFRSRWHALLGTVSGFGCLGLLSSKFGIRSSFVRRSARRCGERITNKAAESTRRFPLDLEVISESALVSFTGGSGAVAWMAISFAGIMFINLLNYLINGNATSPKESNGFHSLLGTAFLLSFTIYNTILFQGSMLFHTGQTAHSMAVQVPLISVGVIALLIIFMLICSFFARLVCMMSVIAVTAYLLGVFKLVAHDGFFASAISEIVDNMWNTRAIVCGYLGACAIGSYIINVKSANTLSYNNGRSKLKLILANMTEYFCTVSLCILTGVTVVGTGLHGALRGYSEYAAAHQIIGIMGGGAWVPMMISTLIVITETYYVHKHWEGLFLRAYGNAGKVLKTAWLSVPLLATISVMMISSGTVNIDVMRFVHTSDRITGVAVFVPLCAWIVRMYLTSTKPSFGDGTNPSSSPTSKEQQAAVSELAVAAAKSSSNNSNQGQRLAA